MSTNIFLLSGILILVIAGFAESQPKQRQRKPKPFDESILQNRDLVYATVGKKKLLLDLYTSKKVKNGPLVIWIHGGGWQNGSKNGNPPVLRLLKQGYAVASIDYRLSGEAIFPAQIEDCKAAIRFLRAHAKKYDLNPDRFGVWGSSAGGHLVALLGTSGGVKEFEKGDHLEVSSRVQAVCDYYGPTDFLQMKGWHNNANSAESKLIGGPILENKEKVAKANPITYITQDDPPILIVHGDSDPVVPVSQSEIFHAALLKKKVDSTLHVLKGAAHGGREFASQEVARKVATFFETHLKP